jgi:hypothetical protein
MITYKKHLSLNRCKIKTIVLNCNVCGKSFTRSQSRRIHELKCEKKISDMVYNKLQLIQTTISDINNITCYNTNTPMSPNIQQITNNTITNNGNINNHIIINNFGNEDNSHITKKQLIKAFKMCNEFPIEMIKLVHFNKEKPENHNIYKPNFKDKYVKYFNDSIWKMGDAKKIITELYMSKMDIAEEKFEELKPYLSELTQDRFQLFLDNREEAEVMTEIIKKIGEMLYNEKSVVLQNLQV